ncbi:MbtH family protein [Streptomyces sp. NPDC007189]|uniref:MbtH family protein n=1 Tax=unclassified Streptomyces TaxID=2593676 RepID=UPI0033EF4A6A
MNAFEDEQRSFHVLRNAAGAYSLWPAGIDIPGGWHAVAGPDSRDGCLRYVEEQADTR